MASRNPVRLLMHVPVPWVFVLTYLCGIMLESVLPRAAWSAGALTAARIAGAMLFAAGAAIAGSALVIFRKARTTTVPGRLSNQLVTWGPYRFTRNPMYVGLTLAYLGEAGILGQIWPVVLLPLTIAYLNWIVIPVEEQRLTEVFGTEYQAYRGKVRRWL